jgi:hypothetical protein
MTFTQGFALGFTFRAFGAEDPEFSPSLYRARFCNRVISCLSNWPSIKAFGSNLATRLHDRLRASFTRKTFSNSKYGKREKVALEHAWTFTGAG